MTKNQNIKKCAEWLAFCLDIGFTKEQLPELEKLWYKYRDENGNLLFNSGQSPEASVATESDSSNGDDKQKIKSLQMELLQLREAIPRLLEKWKDKFVSYDIAIATFRGRNQETHVEVTEFAKQQLHQCIEELSAILSAPSPSLESNKENKEPE